MKIRDLFGEDHEDDRIAPPGPPPTLEELRLIKDLKNGSEVVRYFGNWIGAWMREKLGAPAHYRHPMGQWGARGRNGKSFIRASGGEQVAFSIRNFPHWVKDDKWRRENYALDWDTWYRNREKILAWSHAAAQRRAHNAVEKEEARRRRGMERNPHRDVIDKVTELKDGIGYDMPGRDGRK